MTRHTWQSWRERYKKNASRLDVKITEIVSRVKPMIGEKGQYGYVRKPEDKPKRGKKKTSRQDTEEPVENAINTEAEFLAQPVPERTGIEGDLAPPGQFGGFQQDAGSSGARSTPDGAGVPMDVEAARRTETEEEDDEADFPMRAGSDSQTGWVKRKAEEEEEGSRKRHQSGLVFPPAAFT